LAGPFVKERRSLLGTWTLDGREDETTNFYEAISEVLTEGQLFCQDESGIFDNSVAIATKADVVVLALGESHLATGERNSVADITLSESQTLLVNKMHALGKRIVGVFFCGRPLALGDVAEKLDAILYAWHCGSETAHAACDILFGDAVPSGKTTVTFPRKSTHIPLYYNTTSSGQPVNGYYGENPQLNYIDSLATPLYPFGYGLSYTTFEYKDLKVDKEEIPLEELKAGKEITVSIAVTNTGDFDGKETVQLYIRDKVASILRPLRELKGYKKILIPQNNTKTVEFGLGYKNLGFYNEIGDYIIEKGDFEIFVGANCLADDKVSVSII
jgi:beta-glucosidase